MKPVLAHGRFRWVWAGQTVSLFGDRVHDLAIAWLVLTIDGRPLVLGLVLLTGAIPRALFLIVGGAFTDRFSPRTVLLSSNLVRAGLAGGLAILVVTHTVHVWQLYLVAGAFGTADGFFLPAIGAIVPQLVTDEELVAANALVGTSEQTTMLAGPAVGGVIVAAGGTAVAFMINCASFGLAALGALPVRRGPRARPTHRASIQIWSDLGGALRHAWSDRHLRAVIGLNGADALAYAGIFYVAIPALAAKRFGGVGALGLMLAAWGLGQLAGTLGATLTGLPRRWGIFWIAVDLAACAVFGYIAVAHSLIAVSALFVALGALNAYSEDVALPVWVQRHARPELLGREFGLVELPNHAMAPLALLGMGALVGANLRLGFAAASLVMLLAALGALASRSARELAL